MRTFDKFIVRVPKRMNDEMTLKSGLKLFVDTRFNEFEHRVNEGEVVSTPFKYETPVSVGDTLYFHHLVVINDGQALDDYKDQYLVTYHPTIAVNNQAIGYKSKETGQFHPLNGWAILSEAEVKEEPVSTIIEVVKLTEEPVRKGVVAFDSDETVALGLKVGDVVGIRKNHDSRFKIDGEEFYRTRVEDLLYVEEETI